jgi:hypothetical protein
MGDHIVTTDQTLSRLPVDRRKGVQVEAVSEGRQPGEDVAQVGKGVVAVALAGDDDRVDDRRALAGVRVAYKKPVLLADRRGPDRVFYAEMAVMRSWKPRGICLRGNAIEGACK